jgi:hypothetical protein
MNNQDTCPTTDFAEAFKYYMEHDATTGKKIPTFVLKAISKEENA